VINAVSTSSEAVRGLVKSRVEFAAREFSRGLRPLGNLVALPLAPSRIPPATQARVSVREREKDYVTAEKIQHFIIFYIFQMYKMCNDPASSLRL